MKLTRMGAFCAGMSFISYMRDLIAGHYWAAAVSGGFVAYYAFVMFSERRALCTLRSADFD